LSKRGLSVRGFSWSKFGLALGPVFSVLESTLLKLDFLMLGLLKRLSASGRAFLNGRAAPSLLLRKEPVPPFEGREAPASFELVVLFLIRNAVSLLEFFSS
jgi:hypothetical protein